MPRLQDKVALITGAAQGIGLGIASQFAREGAHVVLADTQESEGASAAQSIRDEQGSAIFVRTDVVQEQEVAACIGAAVEQFGRLDVVVNNAGVCVVQPVEECSVEDWDAVMNVNVRSIFLTTKHALHHLRKQHGSAILNIASISSMIAQQSTPAYCASKGAVQLLTKSLALDFGPDQIRVNCICPGITDTPMLRFHVSHTDDPEAHLKQRLERVPLGEMLYPADIGQAAVFLSSDEARGITGTSLVVDGGYIACAEFHPPNRAQ